MFTNGMKTTELWVTLAVIVAGLVMVITNHLDGDTYWQWATISAGAYALSRGLAKTEPVPPADGQG